MKNIELDDLFKNHLDGKRASVSIGNTFIGGSCERVLTLKYSEHWGLICLDTLEYNDFKPYTEVIKLLDKYKIGWWNDEKLMNELKLLFQSFNIRMAQILPYSVSSYTVEMYKEKLSTVNIKHENGSITNIKISNC